MRRQSERSAIALAEKILTLLEQGSFTATYKYAVLLALLDLSIEGTSNTGVAPTSLTTRQVADRVFELYWPQVLDFDGRSLVQIGGRRGQVAVVPDRVARFRVQVRERFPLVASPLAAARRVLPEAYRRYRDEVEWTLIRYPLVLLQRLPTPVEPFLYTIGWDESVSRGSVRAYQAGRESDFDNRLTLLPDVAANLIRLNGLLRPLIQRQWAAVVASINELPEQRLQEHLFGRTRVNLEAVRMPLLDLQKGRCFYCGRGIQGMAHVDHFLPWSRYADDGLDNLVVAHDRCNSAKRHFLAAEQHLGPWRERVELHGKALEDVAGDAHWPRHPERTLSVVRGVYLGLPEGAPLWVRSQEFTKVDRDLVGRLLV